MAANSSPVMARITSVLSVAIAVILVLVPFHALLTVALSVVTGHYDLLRIWKEMLLLLAVPLAVVLAWKTPGLWKRLRSGWLPWAILSYVLLHVILGTMALANGQVNLFALSYALIINLRLVLIFMVAWVAASSAEHWLGKDLLHAHWRRLLLWPAAVVVGFGLLQAFVLPHDFLTHLGYGQTTIEPFTTVDQKIDYVRIQSTLRGANPLGAYLVIVLTAAVMLLRRRRTRRDAGLIVLLAAGAIVLVLTYSRSAYIGLLLAMVSLVALAVRRWAGRRRLVWGIAGLVVVMAGLLPVFKDNDQIQNTLFHTDEHSISAMSSNEQRASTLQAGLQDVASDPFGRGPGTAGPASVHNSQPGRIAEDYYLQIGQETGWLGLGLFVAIVAMITRRLWHRRSDPLAKTLLASLVGISFINLVQHAWADDTLALVWWGLAGVAMALPVVRGKAKTAAKKMKDKA